MSTLLHKCMTKPLIAESDQRRYGLNWATARRGFLKIFDDHLKCGDWRVDYTEITDAVLCSFHSTFLRVPGYILTVQTAEQIFHFGLNGWGTFWKNELPFDARREKTQIGYTWFSLFIRLLIVAYLGYQAWQWITTE